MKFREELASHIGPWSPSAVSFPIPSRTTRGFSAVPTEDTLVKHTLLATIFAAAVALPAYAADYTIMAPAAPGAMMV